MVLSVRLSLLYLEELRELLGAGLTVSEAVQAIDRVHESDRDHPSHSIATDLRSGASLSQAVGSVGRSPALLVALLRSGEQTSTLQLSLTRYLNHERKMQDLRQRLLGVAVYPITVLAIGFAVLVFLAGYVIPRFAVVFDGINTDLPASARLMVAWSHWSRAHGGLAAAMLILPPAIAAALTLPQAGRHWLLQIVMRMSPVRDSLRSYFLSRWYRTTGLLVDGGIPFLEALRLSHDVLPVSLRAAADVVERDICGGRSPAQAYQRGAMSTPIADQLLTAGERTGDIGNVLLRIADFHENEITRQLEHAMKMAEPLIMAFIGVAVGAIVVLMYMPIFELASTLQ